jgi:hypothetical protein
LWLIQVKIFSKCKVYKSILQIITSFHTRPFTWIFTSFYIEKAPEIQKS